jgi:hypothetical protein
MDFKDQHIRNFLRVISGVILLVYLWDIAFNKIKNGKIYLDVNDGIVITACVAIFLAIEAVRNYVTRKFGSNNNLNNKQAVDNNDENDGEGGVIPGKGY